METVMSTRLPPGLSNWVVKYLYFYLLINYQRQVQQQCQLYRQLPDEWDLCWDGIFLQENHHQEQQEVQQRRHPSPFKWNQKRNVRFFQYFKSASQFLLFSHCGLKKKLKFFSTSDMGVKFISDGKKRGTGAKGCKVSCTKAATKTTTTTTTTTATTTFNTANSTTTSSLKCIMYKLEKTIKKVKSWSDCRDKCNTNDLCEYFHYKVSI